MLNECILLVLIIIIISGSWFLAYLIKRFKKLHLATELGGLLQREGREVNLEFINKSRCEVTKI